MQCGRVAASLGLLDQDPVDISVGRTEQQLANQATLPFGCYYMASHSAETQLLFNPNGRLDSTDTDRVSLCTGVPPDYDYDPDNCGALNADDE